MVKNSKKMMLLCLLFLSSSVTATWFKTSPLLYGEVTYNIPLVAENFGDMHILNSSTPGEFDFIMIPSPAKTPDADSRFKKFKYKHGTLTELESVATPTGSEFTAAGVVQDGAFVICRLSLKPDVTCTYYPAADINAAPQVLVKASNTAATTYNNAGSNTIIVIPATQYFLVTAGNDPLGFNMSVPSFQSNGQGFVTAPPFNPNPIFFLHYQRGSNLVWIGR